MKWLSESDIKQFLNKYNYDVSQSRNARWIDQKCTPDVLTIISDCILSYVSNYGEDVEFTSNKIRHSKYATENVLDIFKKPNPNKIEAKNEYDKFFQQPLELLSYARVITKRKEKSRNYYKINDKDILEYLALREKNSLTFLTDYIEKVLSDSGIYHYFQDFFDKQTNESYEEVKESFTDFTIANTPINEITECRRIFIKVLNPLAFKNNACGTVRGHISKNPITYDMLMYNRDNFRDINNNKPKAITRKEYSCQGSHNNEAYFKYLSNKAKNIVREYNRNYNNGLSELGRNKVDKGTQIHHIFPESQFPSISYYVENLIALTPTEHFNEAHPNGKTTIINKRFQLICLLAKSRTIEDSYLHNRDLYSFSKFIKVLETGLKDTSFNDIKFLDFNAVNNIINLIYNEL